MTTEHDQQEAIASADHEQRLRIAELRSKVQYGYSLLASEAREVFAHYGEPIEEQRKRCEACEGRGTIRRNGYGGMSRYTCAKCNGTGYEVAK